MAKRKFGRMAVGIGDAPIETKISCMGSERIDYPELPLAHAPDGTLDRRHGLASDDNFALDDGDQHCEAFLRCDLR